MCEEGEISAEGGGKWGDGEDKNQNTRAQQVDRYLIVFARINVSILGLNSSCIVSHTHRHTDKQARACTHTHTHINRHLIVFARINVGILWCYSSCIVSRTHRHNTNAIVKIAITK